MRSYIKGVDAKKAFIVAFFEDGKRTDIRSAESGWLKDLSDAMEKKGWDTTGRPLDPIHIKPVIRTNPSDAQRVLNAQKDIYKESIYKMGAPDRLQTDSDVKSAIGGMLSIAAAVAGVKTMGLTTGANAVIGSGIAGDLSKLPHALTSSISLCWPANADLNGTATVDIVKLTDQTNEIQGQIVIAYKTPPTPETSPDGHFKVSHLWPGKLSQAGRVNYA
jgi:hypothetical protein